MLCGTMRSVRLGATCFAPLTAELLFRQLEHVHLSLPLAMLYVLISGYCCANSSPAVAHDSEQSCE